MIAQTLSGVWKWYLGWLKIHICELYGSWPIWPILQKFRPILTPTFWSFFLKNYDFWQNLGCGTKKLDQLQKKYFFEKSYTYVLYTPSMVSIEQLLAKLLNLKVWSWKKRIFWRVQKVPKFFGYQNRSMKSLSYCYHVPNVYSFKIAMNDVLIVPFFFISQRIGLKTKNAFKMKFQKIRFFKTKLWD